MSHSVRRRVATIALFALIGCQSDSSTSTTTNTDINKAVLISASATSQHQQEPTLAEARNGRIVVAWIGTISGAVTTIEYAISEDAGTTWGAPVALPIPSAVQAMSDPQVVVDAAGNFTLVTLGDGPHMGVFVFRLGAGSKAFGAPVSVDEINAGVTHFDKTQIVLTGSGFLVTYSLVGTGGAGIAATSTDGITWQRDTIAKNGPVLITPCATGQSVTSVYLSNCNGGLWTTSSADGGATWGASVELDSTATGSSVPECARRGSDVWILYGTGVSGIHVTHSSDGGGHFAMLATITDGAAFYGQLGMRDDGTLDIAYYLTSADLPFGFAHSTLPPGAALLSQETIRSGLHLTTDKYGVESYADYVGVISAGIAFTDNASGTGHIAFFKP